MSSISIASLTPAPSPGGRRFFQGYQWRFLFADIPAPDAPVPSPGGITTTWADGLLTGRNIAYTLNAPTVITAAVWPDDRRVNQIFQDGDPLVAQGNRVIYAFRREAPPGGPPWVCRAAGILMSPEDQADADQPLTHLVAYDAWQYLGGRPVVDATGQLPPPDGSIVIQSGDSIVTDVLRNAILDEGFAFVDAGAANGGTSFYGGTIETTDDIVFEYQRGMMVADVWRALCDAGNLDIVLTAIYDPVNRPGYTHELNVYRLAGSEQPSAVFAWDKLMRSVTEIDRAHDGTPGNFINEIQYYAGQGGFPVPAAGPLTNDPSIAKYLPYWSNQFQTTQGGSDPTGSAVLAMAQQQLALSKQGLRTMTLSPTPERSPVPLTAYQIGDRVPIYATIRLRVVSAGYQRVQGIPVQITDDGIESIPALLCSPDWNRDRETT